VAIVKRSHRTVAVGASSISRRNSRSRRAFSRRRWKILITAGSPQIACVWRLTSRVRSGPRSSSGRSDRITIVADNSGDGEDVHHLVIGRLLASSSSAVIPFRVSGVTLTESNTSHGVSPWSKSRYFLRPDNGGGRLFGVAVSGGRPTNATSHSRTPEMQSHDARSGGAASANCCV